VQRKGASSNNKGFMEFSLANEYCTAVYGVPMRGN
jgi:hypothetical protein